MAMGAEGRCTAGTGLGLEHIAPGSCAQALGGATGGIMLFEETVPAGTKSWFHLHHDSDEVAYVLSGRSHSRSATRSPPVLPAHALVPRGVHMPVRTAARNPTGAVPLHPGRSGWAG
jgi:uncharacterized RmlC-like cupin family protein